MPPSRRNDAQKYLVETPEVVLPPPPPQPNQATHANSTAHPGDDEPIHQNCLRPKCHRRVKVETHKGKWVTACNNFCSICPFVTFKFCKLVNVPGNKMNPANKIQLKNPAKILYSDGMSSNASSMFTYCVSSWLMSPRRRRRVGVAAVVAAEVCCCCSSFSLEVDVEAYCCG